MRSLLLAAFLAGSLLIVPAASAGTFYVDPAGSNAGACTSPGAGACQTIAGVLIKTRAGSDADTVNLAAGTYEERVTLDQANDDGLTIVGAGSGATTILHGSGDGNFAGFDIGSPTAAPSVQLSDLTIEQDAGPNAEGIDIWTTTGGLSNVVITMGGASNTSPGIALTTGDLTLDHVSVSGAWTGGGVQAGAGSGTLGVHVNDSTIASGNSSAISLTAAGSATGTLDVDRSSLSMSSASGSRVISTINTDITIDSSLLTGGSAGLLASATGSDHTATLRNVTIDAGSPGTADPGDSGVWADSASAGDLMAITMDSSISVEQQKVSTGSGGSVSCTNSDVPNQTATGIACASGGGNSASSASTLFTDAAGGDYHLKLSPLSPAVDSGSSAALGAGESTTDLAGDPRVADGNFDCTATRDKGAYEVPAPTASISAPDQALIGDPVAFSGQLSLGDPPDALTYAWTFSDGGSASTQNPSHAFTALGAQHASLKVMDSHGCFVTAGHDIAIGAKPAQPAPPVSPTGPSSKPLVLKLGGSRKQRLGKFVAVTVSCPNGACTAVATGTLNVPGAAKRFKLRRARSSLAAGGKATLKLALPKAARKAAQHALKRHKRVTARVSVTVTDSVGASRSGRRSLILRP